MTLHPVCLGAGPAGLPCPALLWATESRNTRIQRLHRNGHTYAEIAKRYRVCQYHRPTLGKLLIRQPCVTAFSTGDADSSEFPLGRPIII